MLGFNKEEYMKMQSKKILERINNAGDRLYLEFGGKLFDDYNAQRVLPGFEYDTKIKLLQSMKDKCEIILCIGAKSIENYKIRADIGTTYSEEIFRLIDEFRNLGLLINCVVITQFKNEPAVEIFKNKLEVYGIKVYTQAYIEGYPMDVDLLLSDAGYGANEYIKTSKPLVVVTAPGPGSGKLAVCLSQLYHECKRGIKAQYSKFETFPVWNLPLKHPVNISYEATTADLEDVNMIDPFHLEAYNEVAVNYNRDIEVFPVVKKILQNITGENVYNSPTDMGVNTIGYCIEDDVIVSEAAKQEVIRRYYKSICEHKEGRVSEKTVNRIKLLMKDLDITSLDRDVVSPALEKRNNSGCAAVALKLHSGEFVTGRTTSIMTAGASAILNAIKRIAGINDEVLLISEHILKPIQDLKMVLLGDNNALLDSNDILTALSVCAVSDSTAKLAISQLENLHNIQGHSTYIFTGSEEAMYRNLKIGITSEPNFISDKLYIK